MLRLIIFTENKRVQTSETGNPVDVVTIYEKPLPLKFTNPSLCLVNLSGKPFLESFGSKAFNSLPCNETSFPKVEEVNFRKNYVVYNNLDTAAHYRIVAESGQTIDQRTGVLDPQNGDLGYFSLPDNLRIQLFKAGNCQTVYT